MGQKGVYVHNVDGRRSAYIVVPSDSGPMIACCRENQVEPYVIMEGFGPYVDEEQAQGVADAFNKHIGLSKEEAAEVVATTRRVKHVG
jgi:hypothetical protein